MQTSYSADLHISPDWDVIQKDDIILETLVEVLPKSTQFQTFWTWSIRDIWTMGKRSGSPVPRSMRGSS